VAVKRVHWWLVIGLIGITVGSMALPALSRSLLRNLGRLAGLQVMVGGRQPVALPQWVETQAAAFTPLDQALLLANRGDYRGAATQLASLDTAPAPAAQTAADQGRWDLALALWRSGPVAVASPAWFEAGGICQRKWADLTVLTDAEHRSFCRDLFAGQAGNLLLNGDFGGADLMPWRDTGTLPTELVPGEGSGWALRVNPGDASVRWRLYQTVALPAGTVVRFSAKVRAPEGAPTTARFLYIGRRTPEGNSAGNGIDGANLLLGTAWQTVTRTVTLPPALGQLYQFSPLVLDGGRPLEVDDVRLEVVQ
jgi:hypothetical protein